MIYQERNIIAKMYKYAVITQKRGAYTNSRYHGAVFFFLYWTDWRQELQSSVVRVVIFYGTAPLGIGDIHSLLSKPFKRDLTSCLGLH